MLRNRKINTILIYGGSFDPPHYGHLNTALAVQNDMHFERFIFVPCKIPVLKAATLASSEQRICMLKLALKDHPEFEIDRREISRSSPSYMVDTLISFRDELGDQASITLLLGIEVFTQLPEWHRWEDIFSLSNLLVMRRKLPNEVTLPEPLKARLLTHEVFDKNNLLAHPFGKICLYDAGQYAISSTWLRSQMHSGRNLDPYLPANVLQYIKDHNLYIDDTSNR